MASRFNDLPAHLRGMGATDWMIVGGGFGAFVFSLFPFIGVSRGSFHFSINAWHSYAYGGIFLIFAATALWGALIVVADKVPELPLPAPRLVAIAAGVGTVLVVARGVSYSHQTYQGHSLGVGLQTGGILLIIAGVVVTLGGVLAGRR